MTAYGHHTSSIHLTTLWETQQAGGIMSINNSNNDTNRIHNDNINKYENAVIIVITITINQNNSDSNRYDNNNGIDDQNNGIDDNNNDILKTCG